MIALTIILIGNATTQPEVPPPFTPIPGIPATSTGHKYVSGANSVADKSADEDDVVRVPGIIPPNVLPLQSESSFGTVPRCDMCVFMCGCVSVCIWYGIMST